MTATCTGGRVAESMLCRTVPELAEFEAGRSRSEAENVEDVEEDDEAEEDEALPEYGTVGGRVAEEDMMGEIQEEGMLDLSSDVRPKPG